MNKKVVNIALAVSLSMVSCAPTYCFALSHDSARESKVVAKAATVHQLNTEAQLKNLRSFIESDQVKDGDIIELGGSGLINDDRSDSSPWIIKKNITIRGGSLNVRAGGILLGSNVTFEDVTISLTNPIRNVIMANGYTLTLKNAKRDTGARKIHLFAGGLTGQPTINVPSGPKGEIILSGASSVNNVYAGSLSSDHTNNQFTLESNIIVDSTFTGEIGDLYASGAQETIVNKDEILINPGYEPEAPMVDTTKYVVKGKVIFNISSSRVRNIYGNTGYIDNLGNAQDASLIYNGKKELNSTLKFQDVLELNVQSGNLFPVANSTFSNEKATLSIANDAILNVSNINTGINPLVINDYNGSGMLILGEKQTLKINNTVQGSTNVAIGDYFSNHSTKLPQKNHVYIVAPNSTADSFKLIPHNSDPTMAFTRNGAGEWLVSKEVESGVKIANISLDSVVKVPVDNMGGVDIPLHVEYFPVSSAPMLSSIPLTVLVDNKPTIVVGSEEDGFTYNSDIGAIEIYLSDSGEILSVLGKGEEFQITPEGSYEIKMIVPGKYMQDGMDKELTTTLVVGDAPIPTPPHHETDLSKATVTITGDYIYNGLEQIPNVVVTLDGNTLTKDTDYILETTNNVNAGTATVTIKPAASSIYQGFISQEFTIQKAPLTILNVDIANKTYDGTTDVSVLNVAFDSGPARLITLAQGKDYTVSAHYNDANVKLANQVNVTVTLINDALNNYELQNANFVLANKKIEKAVVNANEGELFVYNQLAKQYEYDLSTMLPTLTGTSNYGDVSYTLGAIALKDYYLNGAIINKNILTLPINQVNSDIEGNVGKIDITISTDNYTINNSFITVKSLNLMALTGNPVLNKTTLVSGEMLSSIQLSGNLNDKDGNPVAGVFTWEEPNKVYTVGTYQAKWIFTPNDTTMYKVVSGLVTITVTPNDVIDKPEKPVEPPVEPPINKPIEKPDIPISKPENNIVPIEPNVEHNTTNLNSQTNTPYHVDSVVPKTSDTNFAIQWVLIACVSGLGALGVYLGLKKKKKN